MRTQTARPPKSRLYPWYDSAWLTAYVRATATLRSDRPDVLSDFVDAFRVLRTRPDFEHVVIDSCLDEDEMTDVRGVVAALRPTDLELHEARSFGRFVVHNHPGFRDLHERLAALVSQVAGEPVEPAYNFLSLYERSGICPPHLDSPEAKWTLDVCIGHSAPWPIYFSQVQAWPEPDASLGSEGNWQDTIKRSDALHFVPCSLQPGQAVIFSGSGQWHYRDAMPDGAGRRFCDLLFFHFIPRGTADLVKPANWARLFNAPELNELA